MKEEEIGAKSDRPRLRGNGVAQDAPSTRKKEGEEARCQITMAPSRPIMARQEVEKKEE